MEIQTRELLKTLSNKTNLEIINLLKNEPSYPRKISEILGMQEGYISRILTHLEKIGILRSKWVYRERNVKLYYVDTKEINIVFEPDGLKIKVKTRGEKEVSVSYDAFKFDIPEASQFVGRTREIAKVELSPIVVIEGIPGIGKTYLAAKYAEKAQKEEKKIFWHTFTEIDSFHYLINKLSVFLNNMGYSNLLEYVKQEGKDNRVLLSLFQAGISEDMVFVFDGFQKVSDTKIVFLFKLLKNVRGKIIITSRERPPFLSLSRTDIVEVRLSSLDEKETREFLHSRGVALHDEFVTCAHRRLGGHPLSLDMFCETIQEKEAADVLKNAPVTEVEDYLWSEIFEKLSERDRKLVECLSMFRVPASPEFLQNICELPGFWTILKGLEKRMFIKRQNGGYVLPSPIMEFTYRKVADKEELHTKIAHYYLEQSSPEGLLEAMYHFLQAGNQEKAAEIAAKPQDVDLIEQGYLSPYMKILTQFSKVQLSPELWCSITYAKGRILTLLGDLKNALKEFEEMKAIAEEIDYKKDYARALHQLGNMYAFHGDWKEARESFDRSLTIMETLKEYQDMVGTYADIGFLLIKQGEFKGAVSHYEAGKRIAEKIGYRFGVSEMLRGIANTYYYQDQFDTALQYYKQSLKLAEELMDVRSIAANYNTLGLIYFYKGEFEEAITCLKKNLEISERISDIHDMIISYSNLGMVYADVKENEKAEEYYWKALELAEELEDPYNVTYLKMKMALFVLQKGEPEKARELCKKCLEIFEQLGKTLHYGEFCRIYGMILREMGEWEKAERFFKRSIEESGDSPLELGQTYLEYAIGLKRQGHLETAKDYYDKSVALFEKVSAKREIEKAKKRWN